MPTRDRDTTLALPEAPRPHRSLGAAVKRALFGIAPEETSFARRGFRGERRRARAPGGGGAARSSPATTRRSRRAAGAVAARIDAELEREFRGFAYEGAGDGPGPARHADPVAARPPRRASSPARATPTPTSPRRARAGPGPAAALPRAAARPARPAAAAGWPLDGYGFHEGYFHWPRSVARQEVPRQAPRLRPAGVRPGARPQPLVRRRAPTSERLPRHDRRLPGRRASRTSGAASGSPAPTRAGAAAPRSRRCGGPPARTRRSSRRASPSPPRRAQRAGNLAAHTELACEVVCGAERRRGRRGDRRGAARTCRADRPDEPAFEVWRRRIQDHFTKGALSTMNDPAVRFLAPQRDAAGGRGADRSPSTASPACPRCRAAERQALAARFAFTRAPLADAARRLDAHDARQVHPSLAATSRPGSPPSGPAWR